MQNSNNRSLLLPALLALFLVSLFASGLLFVNQQFDLAEARFGPASPDLGALEGLQISFELGLRGEELLTPGGLPSSNFAFSIASGEGVNSILRRLAELGLVADPGLLRSYLLYTGLDRQVRSGEFQIEGGASSVEIAQSLLTPNPGQLTLTIFPGWRLEEIAASLPEGGFPFSAEEFLQQAEASADDSAILSSRPAGAGLEGYLLAGSYVFEREVSIDEVVSEVLQASSQAITSELMEAISNAGFSLHEALTLASIVEREGLVEEEMPMIASVFLNRLAIDMRLEADPTAQYALGYDTASESWWIRPLLAEHLRVQSPYNTYQIDGLPPGPISSPSLAALEAVAFPEQSEFLFFQAECNNSGLHVFALTYEEHLANNCP